MKSTSLVVRDYMSHLPLELDRGNTVADAAQAMGEKGFRHVPVMDGPRLFGIISRQDTDRALRDGQGDQTLQETCITEVYKVGPMTPLREVVGEMVSRGIGSAIITDAGLVVGIFTSSDALRALGDLC